MDGRGHHPGSNLNSRGRVQRVRDQPLLAYGYLSSGMAVKSLATHADHYTTNRAYGTGAYSGQVLMNNLPPS